MGLFDWLRGSPSSARAEDATRLFAEVEGPEEYEGFVREVGALAGLELEVSCRSEGRAVSLEVRCGERRITHVQEGFFADLERLLPALGRWLPPGESRRLFDFDGDDFGEEFGVAFVDDAGVARLRADGYRVFTRDAPRESVALEDLALGSVTFHDDGAPRRGTLAADAVIDGVPCAGGSLVELDVRRDGARGALLRATRSRAVELPDVTLPAGTRVDLYEEVATIAVGTLAEPLRVQGIELPAGTELEHGEDGRLYLAILGAATRLPGGREAPRGSILEFRDGAWDLDALDEAPPPTESSYRDRVLTEPETIGRYTFEPGTTLTTREDELVRATLPRPTRLRGVPCAAGVVTFFLGELASLELQEDHPRDGLLCRAGCSLLLWPDGALSEATLAEPAMVAGIELPAGARVLFAEESANPVRVVLPCAATVRGRECMPGQVIELDEGGEVAAWQHVTDPAHVGVYRLVDAAAPYIDS